MTRIVSRRSFLVGLAAGVAVMWVPFRPRSSAGADTWQTLRSALFDACRGETLPLNLGQACLAHHQPDILIREPIELITSFNCATAANVGFADWFKSETMSDFDAGRVVRVNGWVISETEFLLFSGFAGSA
jgi:hypothetical protein